MKTGRRREQLAWALYAWANHAYATAVLVGLFPIFLARYWAQALPGTTSTLYLGLANSAASVIVMILSPWLGALADRQGTKKRWLGWFTGLGVVATASLAAFGAGQWQAALLAFVLSSVGFFAGASFYDALLVQVSTPEEVDRVSAFGYGFGYLGGGLLFLIDVVLVQKPAWFGLADATAATRLAFLTVALWWALFAVPLFRRVDEAPPTAQSSRWRDLLETLKLVLRNKPVLKFLIAYWLYIDAVNTLQVMAVDFGAKLGFSSDVLIGALLMIQFISFPAAIALGRLAGIIGAKWVIQLCLAIFLLVSLGAYWLRTEHQYYALAACVAVAQGGVMGLSRSYFARLIPAGRAGEYFGFYNMLGKFAAVLGPLAVGLVAYWSGDQRLSIMVLAVFFIVGAGLLARVRE